MPYPNGTYINQIIDPAVRNELEQFYSLQQGWESVQHKDDGSHGAVTADSITDAGDLTAATAAIVGAITAEGGRVQIGDIAEGPLGGTITGMDVKEPGGTSEWAIGAAPALTNQRDLRFRDVLAGTGQDYAFRVYQASGVYILEPGTGGPTLQLGTNATGKRISDLYVTNGVHEHARAAAMGEWTDVAFSAGNFTASGAMTWTVTSGEQITLAYTLVGHTLTVAFDIELTTIGGTPAQFLQIAIPAGLTAARAMWNPVLLVDNGTRTTGAAKVAASGTTIQIQRTDAANFSVSTNTGVVGEITFEVQ